MLFVACVLAGLSVVMLVAGPLGARAGLWPFLVGFGLMAGAVLDALAAIIVASIAGARTQRWGTALAAAVVAASAIVVPAVPIIAARGKPRIHDISTDTDDPPAFVALVPLRTGSASPAAYDGPQAAAEQRRAYPDVGPLRVNTTTSRAFDEALRVARGLGWEIVAADREAGRIEAIDTTFWFGFKDDVVIRVRPQGAAARIDVRSKSRVGVGDLGANARRIRLFVSTLQNGVH